MANDFNGILDECIDRLNHSETVESCLADYPEYAKQLAPLLRTAVQAESIYRFTPSADAKRDARQRFYAALDKRQQPSFWQIFFARRSFWATLTAVLVIAIISYFSLRATVFPPGPPTVTVPGPTAGGNFAFLVSDDINALSDFSSLNVTVTKVRLLQTGTSEQWVEFVPEVKAFDLTLLPGDKSQKLWQGNIPEGHYSKEIIFISEVQGTLNDNGQTIVIKLPSDKMQIDVPFQVSAGNVTSFTYDLTVVKTGNSQGGSKYILKPQAGESGTSQTPQ